MNAQVEMFMYAQAARRRSAAQSRATTSSPRCSTPRSTATACRRWTSTSSSCCSRWPATRRRATRSRTASSAFLRQPRPVPAARRATRRSHQPATEEIVRWASPVMYFRRNVTTDTELRGQTIKDGDKVSHLVHLRQPRRGRVRRPVHVRHHARPERARRLRRRRPAPLPRRQPRPHGDPRAARGDGPPRPALERSGEAQTACARTSSAASSTCRCASTPGARELAWTST